MMATGQFYSIQATSGKCQGPRATCLCWKIFWFIWSENLFRGIHFSPRKKFFHRNWSGKAIIM